MSHPSLISIVGHFRFVRNNLLHSLRLLPEKCLALLLEPPRLTLLILSQPTVGRNDEIRVAFY